jgi:hypothetical protein
VRLSQNLLWRAASSQLAPNAKFKDLHRGETCYLIGNGESLKSMDLARFNDKVSIGCNFLFVHNDFAQLDCRYYQIPGPHVFFPFRTYYGKFQRNYLGDLYRKKVRDCQQTRFFTSLANCLDMRGANVSYTHHFGHAPNDPEACDMAGVFSFMGGATAAMLGTAIYMGFTRAVLVGFDYLFAGRTSLHFFEFGRGLPVRDLTNNPTFARLLDVCAQRLELLAVVPPGMSSDIVPCVSYEEYVGTPIKYRENHEIIDGSSIEALDRQGYYGMYPNSTSAMRFQ